MSSKNVIKLLFSIIFFLLSFFIFMFVFFPDMVSSQDEDANEILTKVYVELKQGELMPSFIKKMPKNFFYAIWVKKDNELWQPVLYDKNVLEVDELFNPKDIPDYLNVTARYYKTAIGDYSFVMLVNRFNSEYWIPGVLLPILILLLIYLIIVFLIEILIKDEFMDQEYDDSYGNDLDTMYQDGQRHVADNDSSIEKSSVKNSNLTGEIEFFRDLWVKNFKISDEFKNGFPFKEVYDHVKIGITPETYIKQVIATASDYFSWKNPKLFILQNDLYIDALSKEVLDISKVEIPNDGKQKGKIFIPLFPYNISSIYGYFYFEWNDEEDFYLSDLLYFLKFFFSERAKSIFLNYKELENVIDILKVRLEKQPEVSVAILEVDDRENIELELKAIWKEKLNIEIKENLMNSFKEEVVFQISPFVFGMISSKSNKRELIKEVEAWIGDNEIHNYFLSKQDGNIALSFSCGIAFKDGREIHPLVLINESESNLKRAIQRGRREVFSGQAVLA